MGGFEFVLFVSAYYFVIYTSWMRLELCLGVDVFIFFGFVGAIRDRVRIFVVGVSLFGVFGVELGFYLFEVVSFVRVDGYLVAFVLCGWFMATFGGDLCWLVVVEDGWTIDGDFDVVDVCACFDLFGWVWWIDVQCELLLQLQVLLLWLVFVWLFVAVVLVLFVWCAIALRWCV